MRGLRRFAEGHRGGDLERHVGRVDGVLLAVKEDDFGVHHREVREYTLAGAFHDALLHRADVLLWHGAADDAVFELDAPASRQRPDLQLNACELPVAAGLLLVRVLCLALRADCLAVGHAWRVHLQLDTELAFDPLQVDLDVRVAEAGEDHLAGVGVTFEAQARVFLDDAVEGAAHLVEVGLGLWRNCGAGRGAGERDRLELDVAALGAERVAGLRLGQLGDSADIAGDDPWHLVLGLAGDVVNGADALVNAFRGVPGVGIALECAGEHPEVRQAAHVGVGGRLKDERGQLGRGIGRQLLVAGLDGAVRRRGEVVGDRREKAAHSQHRGPGACEDRDEAAGGDASADAGGEFLRR